MAFTNPKPGGYAYGEKLPSSHVNDIWDNAPDTLDAVGGGTWTLGTAATINGTANFTFGGSGNLICSRPVQFTTSGVEIAVATDVNSGVNVTWLGTSNLPKIGSRSYTLTQPLIPQPTPNVGDTAGIRWNLASAVGDWYQSDVGAAYEIVFPLTRLPNLAVLDKVRVVIDGAGAGGANHGGTLPATLPKATLYRRLLTSGTVTTLGALVTDVPGSAAQYDTLHALAATYNLHDGSGDEWTWTGLSESITSNAYHWIVVNGETGANSVANALSVVGIECMFTCTEVGPG